MRRILPIFLLLIIYFHPLSIQAKAKESVLLPNEQAEIKSSEQIENPKNISSEELDEILGPEPYLGQTAWLSSKTDN